MCNISIVRFKIRFFELKVAKLQRRKEKLKVFVSRYSGYYISVLFLVIEYKAFKPLWLSVYSFSWNEIKHC